MSNSQLPGDQLPEENSREALEARLTALLLGELAAEEEATLRAEIAKDPELVKLQDRLARTIGLIGEAAGSLTEEAAVPAEPLKLSSERREKLLESFKVVSPKELVQRRRFKWPVKSRELVALAAMIISLLVIGATLMLQDEDGSISIRWESHSSFAGKRIVAGEAVSDKEEGWASYNPSPQARAQRAKPRVAARPEAKPNPALGLVDDDAKLAPKEIQDVTMTFSADAGRTIALPYIDNVEVESFAVTPRPWDKSPTPTTEVRLLADQESKSQGIPGPAPAAPPVVLSVVPAEPSVAQPGKPLAGIPVEASGMVPASPVATVAPAPTPLPVSGPKESGTTDGTRRFAAIALPTSVDTIADGEGLAGRTKSFDNSSFEPKPDNALAFEWRFRNNAPRPEPVEVARPELVERARNGRGDVAQAGRGGRGGGMGGRGPEAPPVKGYAAAALDGMSDLDGGKKLLGGEPANAFGRQKGGVAGAGAGFGVENRDYVAVNRNVRFEGLGEPAEKSKSGKDDYLFSLSQDDVGGLKQLYQRPASGTLELPAGNIGSLPVNQTVNEWFGNVAAPSPSQSQSSFAGSGTAKPVPVELKARPALSPATAPQEPTMQLSTIVSDLEVDQPADGRVYNPVPNKTGVAATYAMALRGEPHGVVTITNGVIGATSATFLNGRLDTEFKTIANSSDISNPNLWITTAATNQSTTDFGNIVPATGLPVSNAGNFAYWGSTHTSPDDQDIQLYSLNRKLGRDQINRLGDNVQTKGLAELGVKENAAISHFDSGIVQNESEVSTFYRMRAPNQDFSDAISVEPQKRDSKTVADKEKSATTETRTRALLSAKELESAENNLAAIKELASSGVGAQLQYEAALAKRDALKAEANRYAIALPEVLEQNSAEKPLRLGNTVINETMHDPGVTAGAIPQRTIPGRTLRTQTAQPDVPVDPAVDYINMAVQKKQVEATGRTFPPLPPLSDEVAVKVDAKRQLDGSDIQTADLSKVLETYQDLSGREVLKAPSLPQAKITMEGQSALTREEAAATLETVLAQNQIAMVPQGTKFVKAVSQAQAFQEGKEFKDDSSTVSLSSTNVVTHVVRLTNALPNDLVQILQPFGGMNQSVVAVPGTANLVIRDQPGNVQRMVELAHKLDNVPAGGAGTGTTVGSQRANTGLSSGVSGLGGATRSSFAQRLNQGVNRAASGAGDVPALTPETLAQRQLEETDPDKKELAALMQQRDRLYARVWKEKVDQAIPREAVVEIIDPAEAAPARKSGLWNRVSGIFSSDSERTAKLAVEKEATGGETLGARASSFDPQWDQSQAEKIQSKLVLGKVIERLNLNEAWAGRQGQKLSTSETMALLKKRLSVRQDPKNSSLWDISAKSEDPEEAARIANAVASAYREIRSEGWTSLGSKGLEYLEKEMEAHNKKISALYAKIESRNKETNREPDVPLPKLAPSAAIPQPEITTKENAFSTFSLNVSDVSFKLAAAALEKNQMPDAATVRSEEFINAFDYHDPEPKGSAPVAFAWERARYPFAHNRDLLRFSIKTAASGRLNGRPLNLVLLLDNSGSMERADRVSIIRECLRVLATQLRAEDRVSVIAFARTARLWIDAMPGNQAGELPERVGSLSPQGGTNLEEAMNLAYQTALRHFMANGVNRVVLLTDGAANLGDVQPESLKKKVEAHRQQGVALDCFGIGWEGLNDDLLEILSRNGDGRYGFVNSPAAAATEFAGQLAGALQVAASDVKVQVEFNPKRVTSYRQIGYAKHQLKKEQFRDNTVDAAEIAAAEAGNALYTVEVNPSGEGPVATVRVRFKIPGSMDFREHEWAVPYEGPAKALEQSSPTMRLAGVASAFSEWLVSSPFSGEVTTDALLKMMSGVPESFDSDPRPKKLVEMLRQARSLSGK